MSVVSQTLEFSLNFQHVFQDGIIFLFELLTTLFLSFQLIDQSLNELAVVLVVLVCLTDSDLFVRSLELAISDCNF